MAPGAAKSDFDLQVWIDTLGLKQIFLIFSVSSEGAFFKHIKQTNKKSILKLVLNIKSRRRMLKDIKPVIVDCTIVWIDRDSLFTGTSYRQKFVNTAEKNAMKLVKTSERCQVR